MKERNGRRFWRAVRVALADLIDPMRGRKRRAAEQQAREDAHDTFHALWSKVALGAPYEKRMWKDLNYQLDKLGVGPPAERSSGTTGENQGSVPAEPGIGAKSPRRGPRWGLKDWLLLPFGIAGVLWLFVLAWMLVGWWSIPAWLTLGVVFWKRDPEEVHAAIMVIILVGFGLSLPYLFLTMFTGTNRLGAGLFTVVFWLVVAWLYLHPPEPWEPG